MTDYALAAAVASFGVNYKSSFGSSLFQGPGTMLRHQSATGVYLTPVTSGGSTVTVEVQLDTLEGANARRNITGGWSITQVAVVTGLNASHTDDTAELYDAAIKAVAAITGDRGSQCVSIADVPTYLEEFIPEIMNLETVRVHIIYKGYPAPVYEFDGALTQIETFRFKDGTPIVTTYTYPTGYPINPARLNPDGSGRTLTQGCKVPMPLCEPCFTVHWIVTAGTLAGYGDVSATDMMTHYGSMEGKVNASTYTIGIVVGTARQWMITRVHGVSRNGGVTFEASMTFQFRGGWVVNADPDHVPPIAGVPRSWDPVATFVNPDDGNPPPDLVAGDGYFAVAVADAIEFPTFTFGGN